ncbi:hypothetical protein R6Q57_009609 [Mikania cordata]
MLLLATVVAAGAVQRDDASNPRSEMETVAVLRSSFATCIGPSIRPDFGRSRNGSIAFATGLNKEITCVLYLIVGRAVYKRYLYMLSLCFACGSGYRMVGGVLCLLIYMSVAYLCPFTSLLTLVYIVC